MNRSIALVSAALLLGAAPVVALAQSNTQQPATGTYHAPNTSGTQHQIPTQKQNATGSASGMSGENANSPMAATKSPEEVQKVQSALNQKGEKVKVDGIWGPQTAEAVRDFQRKNGLQPSGELDS